MYVSPQHMYSCSILLSKTSCSDWALNRACDPGHNIYELCNILVKFRFTTNKLLLDIQYSKRYIRVTKQVVKRLQTQSLRKLGSIAKVSKLGKHTAQLDLDVFKKFFTKDWALIQTGRLIEPWLDIRSFAMQQLFKQQL